MRNYLFLCIVLIQTFLLNAQSNEISLDNLEQTFHIDNKTTEESILLLKTKDNTLLSYFDAQHQIKKSFTINNPESSFKQLIAYSLDGDVAQLFWSTTAKKNLFIQSINLETQIVTEKEEAYSIKGLFLLTEFSNGTSYFAITLKKNTNIIVIHEFKSDGTFQEHPIDLSNEKFYTLTPTKPFNLQNILSKTTNEDIIPNKIQFIDQKQPSALSLATKLKKAYLKNQQLIITFDYNTNFTDILTIDLESKSYKKSIVTKPKMAYSSNTSSNSFIHDDFIYQVKANEDEFHFTIKTLNNELIKSWITKENENISYMVDGIKQFDGDQNKYKSLGTTGAFIKKFNNLQGGLSVYTYNSNKLVTIGSVSAQQQKPTFGMFFGLIGALVDIYLYNPSINNLDAYANRRTVHFNSILNNNFETTHTHFGDLAIDKINNFINENHKQMSSINLSIKNNTYFLGYYSKNEKKYKWQSFKD